MTDTAKEKEEALKKLKLFIKNLPEYFSGISAGYVEYLGEAKGLLYQKDIEALTKLLDFYFNRMHEINSIKIEAILWHIDRLLLEHDLRCSKHASKELREDLEQYTAFMKPTGRSILQLENMILDLFCYFFGIYSLIATVQALKKATKIKGFDFIITQMDMDKTAFDLKSMSFREMKKACRESAGFKFEDYLTCINKGMLELKERGLDLKIPPLDFRKVRPNTNTLNAIIESGAFTAPHISLEGDYLISIYQAHEAYRKQVWNSYLEYEGLLLDNEREYRPEAYARFLES